MSAIRGRPTRHSTRPLLMNEEPTMEATLNSEAPQFYFEFSWRQMFPKSRAGLPRQCQRLIRRELWDKHGQPMHFLTLEFQDDATERDYVADSTRRTKRWVEYALLTMAIFNWLNAVLRWVMKGYGAAGVKDNDRSVAGPGDAITSATLYSLEYLQIRFDRDFVRRNLQPVLFFWSILQLTNIFVWVRYLMPLEYRALAEAANAHTDLWLQESILNETVVTLIACRMRFFYFLIFSLYAFFGYKLLMPPGDRSWKHQFIICAGFVFLSYTIEVWQRKDFIQSFMVWKEGKRSQVLLQNILPASIIEQMKATDGQRSIARSYKQVTVLFADVVSFTTMSAMTSPQLLVELLNRMFRGFDDLAERLGVEKIKTIGDCYMAAAGLPLEDPNHAKTMARFGLQMLQLINSGAFCDPTSGNPIQVRVGIHSGPCVAGVIGHKKFAYDIWGDAVNTAARMESHGEAMRLHCSSDTRQLLGEEFKCVPRAPMKVKGKGEMETYFVIADTKQDIRSSQISQVHSCESTNVVAMSSRPHE